MAWSLVFGVGFVPAGAFVVAANATTAGTRAAIRTGTDTATAPNDPGLP
jgi:hypothetical protein